MRVRVVAALAGVAVFLCGAGGSAQTTMAPTPGPVVGPTATPVPTARPATLPMPAEGPVALDARYLRGTRTGNGYRLTGQALVNDACRSARFTRFLGNIFPPLFNVVQFRRAGTMGMLCIQRLTWVTIQPLTVTSAAPPRWVTAHTRKGSVRVPILPLPPVAE
jgi:hypothetical protein